MPALTVRLSQEEYDSLKIQAHIERRKLVELIRNAISTYLEQQGAELVDEIRRRVAAARAKDPQELEAIRRAAKRVARLDDREGLGPIKVVRGDKVKATKPAEAKGSR